MAQHSRFSRPAVHLGRAGAPHPVHPPDPDHPHRRVLPGQVFSPPRGRPWCFATPASASPSPRPCPRATPGRVSVGGALVFASSISYAPLSGGQRGDDRPPQGLRFSALAMLVSSAVTLAHFAATPPSAFVQPLPVWAGAVMASSPQWCRSSPSRRRSAASGAGRSAPDRHGRSLACRLRLVAPRRRGVAGPTARAALVVAGIFLVSRR